MQTVYTVVSVHRGVIFNVAVFGRKEDAIKCYDELMVDASDEDAVDWFPCEII